MLDHATCHAFFDEAMFLANQIMNVHQENDTSVTLCTTKFLPSQIPDSMITAFTQGSIAQVGDGAIIL